MKLRGVILVLFAAVAAQLQAQNYAVNGSCTLGGQATVTQGMPSSGTRPLRGSTTFNGTGVMASYPGCTVTVFQTGTNTPALIYSTVSGAALSNPFTANLTDGSWVFFAPAGCFDITISSGATQASTMPNSKTFPGVCGGAGSGGGGGGGGTAGTQVTINGTAAVPNALNFSNVLLPPANGTIINFLLNGNNTGAYLPGNGNASNCLSGTGTWVACSGGGGGGGTLPTTAQYDLFASTGAGAAQASGVLGNSGFVRAQVYTATGDVTSASPGFQLFPNASVEYFPTGYANSQGNFGAANGLALYMSHSGQSAATGNGGVALGGGNSSGTGNQVYVDCETTGCDFKVPLTVNGSGVGGGGGGGLPTIPAPNLFASNGSGSAVDSGVLGQSGFLRAYVLEATGTGNASPFTVPNGSIEYFPTGGYGAGGANGVALHVSHSGSTTGFGGIALAGGNTSGADQLYIDCEGPPVVAALGCDFKVPVTYLGNSLGGGGGGSGTVGSGTGGHFTWYASTGTAVTSNANLDDSVTTASTITSQEPIAAPSVNINGATGTGIAMTGVGGTLPTVATGSGGVGIGPGGIPEYNPNGTGWTAIGSGGGGGITGATANGGLSQTSTTLGLLTTCTTNQYLSFSGTAWVCTPAPTGGGTVTGATANGGLVATGNTLGLLTSCSNGQVLQWNGTAWACTTPTGAGSGSGTVSSATGAAGQLAYYPPNWVASRAYILNALIVDSNNNVQKVTTAGTSGATAPTWATTLNGTTSDGGTLVWTLVQVGGGATYVAPLAVTISSTGGTAAGTGINLGFGLLQFASNIVGTTPDASIGRPAANLLVFGNGTTNSVSTMIYSGNSCAPSADISLSTTQTAICSKTLPASARTWIFHCTVPWGFTGGTGNATMQFLLNLSAAPTTRTFLSTWTISPTGPSNYGAVSLSGAGNTTILTTSALSVSDATIFTTFIEGSINAPAAGMNSFLYMVIGSGATSPTASAYAGAFCRYE